MWPWRNHRLAEAREQEAEAEVRQRDAEKLAERSRAVTARLRGELDKNGFTELLQFAWGGRS